MTYITSRKYTGIGRTTLRITAYLPCLIFVNEKDLASVIFCNPTYFVTFAPYYFKTCFCFEAHSPF